MYLSGHEQRKKRRINSSENCANLKWNDPCNPLKCLFPLHLVCTQLIHLSTTYQLKFIRSHLHLTGWKQVCPSWHPSGACGAWYFQNQTSSSRCFDFSIFVLYDGISIRVTGDVTPIRRDVNSRYTSLFSLRRYIYVPICTRSIRLSLSSLPRLSVGIPGISMASSTFTLFVFFCFLAPSGFAGPLIHRRAITSNLLYSFAFYEQCAAAAYCPGDTNSTNSKITWSTTTCPLVQAANMVSILEFQNTIGTDTTGFLASDDTNKQIVLSFRGSESFNNWVANAAFQLKQEQVCKGCQVETGFWLSRLAVRNVLMKDIFAT